ncbi:GspH/FimT family pseudopilin [Pseudomonas sp.]|uniref:GspH/FimT family pseudopilin n=1 Tax=Pseudomonas sp. TaxID=306 RepID=UPI00273495A9|nr:GspH/FimT family pseudopilin [Pseudomonas sp.]MDP3813571.1 GspH/FimT family pseudopilin [Pseudomonas sp.]
MSQKGFTLIELMVTLAVMAILLGIAAPSFSQMLRDNRAASELNVFVSMFNFARSEAASRGLRVRVQGPLAVDDSWQVVRVTSGEVLRVFPALSAFTVAPDGEKNMVFDAQGRLEANAAVVFSVQAKTDYASCEKYNREVTVNLAGTVTLRQEDC